MRLRVIRRPSWILFISAIDAVQTRSIATYTDANDPGCIDALYNNDSPIDIEGPSLLLLMHQVYTAAAKLDIVDIRTSNADETLIFLSILMADGTLLGENGNKTIIVPDHYNPIVAQFVIDFLNRPADVFPDAERSNIGVGVLSDEWNCLIRTIFTPGCTHNLFLGPPAFKTPFDFTIHADSLMLESPDETALPQEHIANAELAVAQANVIQLSVKHVAYRNCVFTNTYVKRAVTSMRLPFIHNFPNMTKLFLYGNGVPTIDATGCPRLLKVGISVFHAETYTAILQQVPSLVQRICIMEQPEYVEDILHAMRLIDEHAPHIHSDTWLPKLHALYGPTHNRLAASFFLAIDRLNTTTPLGEEQVAHVDPAAIEYVMRHLSRSDITSMYA